MKNNTTNLFLNVFVFFISLLLVHQSRAQTLTPKPGISMTSNTNGYYEYLPVGYNSGSQAYPLMIFMEGLGEMGDGSAGQVSKLLDNGPLYYINAGGFPTSFTVNGVTSSFIIITPQFMQLPVTPSEVDSVITYAVQHYRVNTNKIYVTGLSMGGGQTWDYVGASPAYASRVAAIVPFASATEPSLSVVIPKARIIANANLPVWAFHNSGDDVSDTITTNYIKYINQAPAPNPLAKATIFNQVGHDCWSPAYYGSYNEGGLNIYQWMLQYQRNGTPPPPPVNQSPKANAGAAQTITLPVAVVTLTGSGTDPDGTISSYKWTYISGPSQYTITSPNQAQTTVTNLAQGTYVFQLMVTDNQGATATASVGVTVNAAPNQSPTANAGAAQNITLPVASATLTGSGTDPDGTIASYNWSYVSGPSQYTITSPAQAQTTVTNLVQGNYVFQLTVTDNQGATAKANTTITVNPAPNQPPVVNAGTAQTITLPVSSVTLSGTANDADGSISAYKWTYISGPSQYAITSPNQLSTTVTGLAQGVYVFQLSVTDNQGATASSNVNVTVNAAINKPPVANAGTAQVITLPVSTITLTGSGSDPDGSISSYKWTYISGPLQYNITSPNQAQTTVTGLVQGSYTFQLTVSDNLGANASSTVVITVNAATNQTPVANAGSAQTITLPLSSVTLSGSGNDPDGTIASYKWTYASGPSQYTITSPAQAQTTVTNLTQGSYVFQLTVTDNMGASASSNVTVTVNAAPVNQLPTANAGSAQTITLPLSSVTLSGSGNDPDGTIASYKWTYASGPSQYTITSPTQAQTTVTNLTQGSYVFQLTVTDNMGASASSNVTVTVNAAPVTPPGTNYVAVPGKLEAENYNAMSGVQIENTTDAGGGSDVGYIDPTDWMEYNINPTTAGSYSIDFRLASPASNAVFELRKPDGTVLTTVHVPNTGGYQTWQTVSAVVTLTAGQQTLRIVSTGAQWNNWNINWLYFNQSAITPPPPPPPPPPTGSTIHIEAENYTAMSGIQTETTQDAGGGLDVDYIDPADWMDYSISVPAAGSYNVSFRIAAPANNAQLQLRKADGTVLATVTLPNTGGYQTWQTVKAIVTLPAGQQTLRIVSTGPQWNNWNINWMELNSTTTPAPVPVNGPIHIEAENYASMNGVQTENTTDAGGGLDVGYIDTNDWMDYNVSIPSAGTYTFSFRIASPANNAQLQLRKADGSVLGTLNILNTGGFQAWQTMNMVVSLPAGQQTLRIVSTSSQWNNWNINWLDINSGTLSTVSGSSIAGNLQSASISIYPNPIQQQAVVNVENQLTGVLDIFVYNLNGRLVKEIHLVKPYAGLFTTNLNLNELSNGSYFIRVNMKEWNGTKRFIKVN